MNKQEKIQEAYGESFEEAKEFLDKNGWDTRLKFKRDYKVQEFQIKGHGIYLTRPIELKGIEHNNGWIKIESIDDLPKDKGYFNCLYDDGEIIPHHFSMNSDFDKTLFLEEFTHYQPIEKPKPPIY